MGRTLTFYVEENEIVGLALAGAFSIAALVLYSHRELGRFLPITLAFILLACGRVLTVIEVAIWPDLIQLLEHLCSMGAALAVAVACVQLMRGRTLPA